MLRALYQATEFSLNYSLQTDFDKLTMILSMIMQANGQKCLKMESEYFSEATWDAIFRLHDSEITRLIVLDEDKNEITVLMVLPLTQTKEIGSCPLEKITEVLLKIKVSDYTSTQLLNYKTIFDTLYLKLIGAMQAKLDQIVQQTLAAEARMNEEKKEKKRRRRRDKRARRRARDAAANQHGSENESSSADQTEPDMEYDNTGITGLDTEAAIWWASQLLEDPKRTDT